MFSNEEKKLNEPQNTYFKRIITIVIKESWGVKYTQRNSSVNLKNEL